MIVNSGNLRVLYRAYSAAYREGFGQAPADHMAFTLETRSMSRTTEYGWLGQYPGLKEWVGERTLRGIAEHGYAIRNRKFEATIEISRDDIDDDQYGVYAPMFAEMGRAAAAHPTELAFEALATGHETACYDGQYFFDTDHPGHDGASVSNVSAAGGATAWYLMDCSRMIKPIILQKRRDYHMAYMDSLDDEHVFKFDAFRYGVDGRCNAGYGLWQLAYRSTQALTATNYEAARTVLHNMVGDEGRPMGVMPTHLVVPPSLEGDALELLTAERNAAGATNVWRGTATVIMSQWLAAAA